MNITLESKNSHIKESLWVKYNGQVGLFESKDMVDFALHIIKEQAEFDLNFLSQIQDALDDNDIEGAHILLRDWRSELENVIDDNK